MIDGLTFSQRRARIRALVSRPLPSPPPVPLVLRLQTDKFTAFVRFSECEQRPVNEVMEEWLSDCARLIGRDELFEGSSHAMTPAMHRAALASDERERWPAWTTSTPTSRTVAPEQITSRSPWRWRADPADAMIGIVTASSPAMVGLFRLVMLSRIELRFHTNQVDANFLELGTNTIAIGPEGCFSR